MLYGETGTNADTERRKKSYLAPVPGLRLVETAQRSDEACVE